MCRSVTILIFILVPEVLATTYYVSTTGDDSWNGTSPDSAFATLQHAANSVVPGDSVLALSGSYAGFDMRTGGTESDPIIFSTAEEGVWIDQENPVTQDGINLEGADWVVIDGFNLTGLPRNGIRVALSDHVIVRNCYCENCYERGIFTAFAEWITIEQNECCGSIDEHGIYHSNSGDHPVIRFNICHNNNGCGIHMNGDLSSGGDGIISDATIEGNVIYENGQGGGSGINCDGVVESRIFNNLLYMNHGSGISLYMIDAATGSHHVEVYNNTIVQPDDGRWAININTESTYATLLNNIVLSDHSSRGSIAIDLSSQEGFESSFNLVENRLSVDGGNTVISLSAWQALGYGEFSEVCTGWGETFINWPAEDYHSQAGSQAVDSGTFQVQPIVLEDLDGVLRPQGSGYDMGCYERYPESIEHGGGTPEDIIGIVQGSGCVMFVNLPEASDVGIYDITGRCLSALESNEGNAVWQYDGCPIGVYLYSARSPEGEILQIGKILYLTD